MRHQAIEIPSKFTCLSRSRAKGQLKTRSHEHRDMRRQAIEIPNKFTNSSRSRIAHPPTGKISLIGALSHFLSRLLAIHVENKIVEDPDPTMVTV